MLRPRLVTPLIRKPGQPGGFVPIPYPNALEIAARRLAEIQERDGDDAVALVGDGTAPTAAAIAVESQVVVLAGSTLGGVVRLLVESGQIDVQVVADGSDAMRDAALRRIDDARELVRAIEAGEVKGLVSICFDPPAAVRLADTLDKLEFHLAIDTVLGPVARRADIVLPLSPARAADVAADLDEPLD